MQLSFLAGTGDMARRIREYAWDRSPLGAPQHWPAPLKATLRLALATRQPVFIFWGPEQICLHNDACAALLDPEAQSRLLGASGRAAWPEAWGVIGPQVDRVMRGGGPTRMEVQPAPILRHGALQQGSWTFDCTSIDDDTRPAVVGGALLVATEPAPRATASPDTDTDTDIDTTVAAGHGAEWRRSQAELQEREEQLRLATEAADIGLWDVDLVHGSLFWPARVKAMFGISPQVQVTLADFYAGLHPDDFAHTTEAFQGALDPLQRTTYDVEYRTVGKEDGRIRWIAAKGRGIFDEHGTCVRAIGTAIDITRRKADEARLRELNDQLERRVADALADKKVLADVVEGTDAFVLVADLNFRLLAINRAGADEFERVYGVRPRVGDDMLQLLEDQPAHRDDIRSIWGRALAGEEFTVVGEFGDETRDRRHYELKFNTLRDRDGTRRGAYQFVYDVTDRVRDQERLARAEDALRQAQKMEAVGHLTGGIAHDFNNVMQGVQASLQLIHRLPSDPRVKAWSESALKSIKRGSELTSQLLTFARKQQLELRPLVVSRLVEGMREMVRRSLGPLIRFEVRDAAGDAAVLADSTQLEMAILNLAINARDAMPDGGCVTISTETRRIEAHPSLARGDYVALSVGDTGTGMSAEVLARAFDPFFTTKGVGKGTGLGLSQVYGMAQQTGGAAVIRSEPDQGTTVTLLLPRCEAATAASGVPGVPPEAAVASQQRLRILVIDDDEEVRKLLVASLEVLGHAVVAAPDGVSGLQRLDAAPPDLLIVDFAMPGMNGAQVAELARQRRPELPIVFASGYADIAAIEAVSGPSASILRKPFDLDELDAAVKSLVAGGTRGG